MPARPLRWQPLLLAALASLMLVLGSCSDSRAPREGELALRLWHGINPPANREVFERLVERFNRRQPDLRVEPRYLGQPSDQLPKILTAIVGEATPDLLWFAPQITGQLVALGAIRPLDEWLARTGLRERIEPALLESMQLDGRSWSVPLGTNNAAIFYRPSLFEQAGIEQPPQTWAELRQVARRLTRDRDGDGTPEQYGLLLSLGQNEWTVFAWLPFVYAAGGELVDADGEPQLVDPGTAEALQFGVDLVAQDWATLSPPNRGFLLEGFLTGRAAMQVTGPWTLRQLRQSDVDYDAFPFPARQQQAAVVGGENLFAFQSTPERERAALRFLEFVLSDEFQIEWARETGYLPVTTTARQSEAYREVVRENPVLNIFLQQMGWARSRPIRAGYARISKHFGRAIEASLLGQAEPGEALADAQAHLELMLDPAGRD
ncbi:MAG: ABC transporter substrate-binding protein [Cyanobacteria bacterium QS_8_64_29]|nr:MAG: ABC transporter substrate-binding protein [Cyanobacteria bacterium QS_8_64_29]